MDSLTQIVLGSAVGEVCLGKKLGNKAMVWGAIAGTIPDMDIIGNLWMNDLEGLVFHRGISHSLFFALTFSVFMAWLTKWWYGNGMHQLEGLRRLGLISTMALVVILGAIWSFAGFAIGHWSGLSIMLTLSLAFCIPMIKRAWASHLNPPDIDINISYGMWYNFFFWTIVTHPILDCFTVYGTQLFAPFSDVRISWDNISVADPIYTIMLGLPLMIGSWRHRLSRERRVWLWIAILLSSGYMMLTFIHKHKVEHTLRASLEQSGITYQRYMTTPSILNNILWSGTVELDTSFLIGQYSLFDKEDKFTWIEVPKNHDLLSNKDRDHTIQVLRWFSKDYYAVLRRNDGALQVNDLRYGLMDEMGDNTTNEEAYIFKFVLDQTSTGYQLDESKGGPPRGRERDMFKRLWTRIKGI